MSVNPAFSSSPAIPINGVSSTHSNGSPPNGIYLNEMPIARSMSNHSEYLSTSPSSPFILVHRPTPTEPFNPEDTEQVKKVLASMMQLQPEEAEYQSIQNQKNQHKTKEFVKKLVSGDLHVHFEGLLSPADLVEEAKKMDQIRWNTEEKKFVSITASQSRDPLVRLNDLDQNTLDEIYSAMVLSVDGTSANPIESTNKFFEKFDLRENLMNLIGLAGLFPLIHKYLKLKGNRYVELMTVLTYKEEPVEFEALFNANNYDSFLEQPQVVKWIKNFVSECSTTLDRCKKNVSDSLGGNHLSSSQTIEKRPVDCFKIIQPEDNPFTNEQTADTDPLTIRITYEIMRNIKEDYKFFTRLAAVCELIKEDSRVVSFTMCGPQNDIISKEKMRIQSKMLEFMKGRYQSHFRFNPHFGEITPSMVTLDFAKNEWDYLGQWATRRIGHGVAALGHAKQLIEKNIAVEVCLCSNMATLKIPYAKHPIRGFLASNVPVVFGSDDPGVIECDFDDNRSEAINESVMTFAQLLDSSRAAATYSHLNGASIYCKGTSTFNPIFKDHILHDKPLNAEARAFLMESERAQLEVIFEKKIQRFIKETALSRRV